MAMHLYSGVNDMTRTWNMKLMATENLPETTIEGVSQEDTTKILRGLMYGPDSRDYTHVEAAVSAAHEHRNESLAA